VTATAERFSLELPGDPAFMATARMFASSLARHFEIEEDVVEDLKVAISEACARALASKTPDQPVTLRIARDEERLVFEVSQGDLRPAAAGETPTPSHEELAAGMSLELITALFEDAELSSDDQGAAVVRFSLA
jgi:anti-sigma regulatory factor (Ser/Thr protein kinase)